MSAQSKLLVMTRARQGDCWRSGRPTSDAVADWLHRSQRFALDRWPGMRSGGQARAKLPPCSAACRLRSLALRCVFGGLSSRTTWALFCRDRLDHRRTSPDGREWGLGSCPRRAKQRLHCGDRQRCSAIKTNVAILISAPEQNPLGSGQ